MKLSIPHKINFSLQFIYFYAVYFNRPYQLDTNNFARVRRCLIFGAFVFLFLFVFRPFGIAGAGDSLLSITIGYGLVCTVVMLLLNVATLPLLPNFFSEDKWTLGRELAWTVVNVFFIGLANAVFTAMIGVSEFSLRAIVSFEIYTLSLGVFPAAMAIVLNEARLKHQFEKETQAINDAMVPRAANKLADAHHLVSLISENASETFSIAIEDLMYIKAADNYAEIYYTEAAVVQRKVIRNTLKNLESFLSNEQILRCHKSYLVNLIWVDHVTGNAQGYKLHLKNCQDEIPVSRQLNDLIKAKLANRPKPSN